LARREAVRIGGTFQRKRTASGGILKDWPRKGGKKRRGDITFRRGKGEQEGERKTFIKDFWKWRGEVI